MATRPVQGGSSGTWGTELNAWLDVGHNSDGTLKVASSTLACDYLFTTTGTTITVYNKTGVQVGTGTDLGALVNAVADNYLSLWFTSGVFPWTTAIDLDTLIGVQLQGAGGRQNESKGSVGGRGATQFKWTPASGQAFSAEGTQGLTVRHISFQWISNSYTSGDGTEDGIPFMTIEGVDHTTPTRHALLEACYFGAGTGGKLDSGGPVLDVNKTVNIAIRDSLFVGGTMSLRSHHTIEADDFANVVDITACRFSRYKAPTSSTAGWPCFYGSGQSWTFRACHWEPSAAGPHFIHKTAIDSFNGLTFEDCWIGDQSGTPAASAAFIEFRGSGLRIIGGRMTLADGYSILKTSGSTAGVNISGLSLVSSDEAASGVINCAANGIPDLTINALSGYPTVVPLISGNMPQPPRTGQVPFVSVSANTTLSHSDHDRVIGVDASGGALTITLPSAVCVGCKLTIKKTDASANAVSVVRAGSNTIDGATSFSLATQYKFVSLIASGSAWNVIGSN